MTMFKPVSTLAVGVLIGMFVVPRVLRAANINVPGA